MPRRLAPELRIVLCEVGGAHVVDFIDDGAGIVAAELIVETFSRLGHQR